MHTNKEISEELKQIGFLPVGVSPNSTYRVPKEYFDTLPRNILATIQDQSKGLGQSEQEWHGIAPLLSSVSKANVYAVPSGYFKNISFVPEKHPAKLIQTKFVSRWVKYVAAAVLTGVLLTGYFLYVGYKKVQSFEYSSTDISAELQNMSDEDLGIYLYSVGADTKLAPDVKNGIGDMSDEELKQYLSEKSDIEIIIPVLN